MISSTADVENTDTLKIGKLNNINKDVYFTLPLSVTDANANLQNLNINVGDGITLTDNDGKVAATYYDLNYSPVNAEWFKIFRLIPTNPGYYTVIATVTDKFNMQASLSKQIYAFDNMPPRCVVAEAYYTAPPNFLYVVRIDIRSSFDQDEKWGGGIAEYKAIYHYTWDDEAVGMASDFDGTPGIFECTDAPWEPIGWVEAWVIDNEGAESEHIRIDLTLKP